MTTTQKPTLQPAVVAQEIAEHIDTLEQLACQANANAATQIRLGVAALRQAMTETVGDYDTLTGRWVDDYAATRIGDQWVVVCENGLNVNVPLFIKQGEKIKVSTENKEYLGRA